MGYEGVQVSRDRAMRRLVVCTACKYDRAHVYRDEAGTVTVACASCGGEIFTAKGEPAQ